MKKETYLTIMAVTSVIGAVISVLSFWQSRKKAEEAKILVKSFGGY